MVSSELAEATRPPPGLNASDTTKVACPRRVRTSAPEAASQSRTVLAEPPSVAMRRPSGLYATQ